ncbi:MAG: phosphate-starvation-inducible PsiE family protein [Leptolyngbyaceae bacterium]|nr:phosphate-starvation-inducible PsiE family protein [Leptolyngbyaceae bacterium]
MKRNRIVRTLEIVQDLIVVSLCIGLFTVMVIQLRAMFILLLPPLDFPAVASDILFLLILVELFRLLIIYLQEQRVSIGVAVEVSIVSVLREIIVRGVLEASWTQVMSACAFLLVLSVLLVVRVWIPPTFSGIDPEKLLANRAKIMNQSGQQGDHSPEADGQLASHAIPSNIPKPNTHVISTSEV